MATEESVKLGTCMYRVCALAVYHTELKNSDPSSSNTTVTPIMSHAHQPSSYAIPYTYQSRREGLSIYNIIAVS